jgi:hypothetical protein
MPRRQIGSHTLVRNLEWLKEPQSVLLEALRFMLHKDINCELDAVLYPKVEMIGLTVEVVII